MRPQHRGRRAPPPSPPAPRPLRRFRPLAGQALGMHHIRGAWRPSGAVAGAGIWAVVWQTTSATYWAALADFEPAAQLQLIDACRQIDFDQFGAAR